jgi:hypothetical protein
MNGWAMVKDTCPSLWFDALGAFEFVEVAVDRRCIFYIPRARK